MSSRIAASLTIRRILCIFFNILPMEPILFNFPSEVLFQIFSCLALPSQVCLVLSCKSLYHLFGLASELQFPRLPSNGILSSSRMMLLTQLEDSHWAFCGACQRLHPRKDFLMSRLKVWFSHGNKSAACGQA